MMPTNKRKRRPTHPGEILREDVLPGAGLTQDKLARLLGVSRPTISEILNERRPVTTDMTHRLSRAFGTSPEMWLGLSKTSICGIHIKLDTKNTTALSEFRFRKLHR